MALISDAEARALFAALKLASCHMSCALYADHAVFEAAVEKVFETIARFEPRLGRANQLRPE